MKNRIIHSCISIICCSALIGGLLSACREIGPNIELHSTGGTKLLDSTWIAGTLDTVQHRVVLLEEFTGVQCINCATGHALANTIKTSNPNQVAAVALHSYLLDDPYPYSLLNLKSDKAEQINSTYGPAPAKPMAMINRKVFPGETSKIYFTSKWTAYTNSEVASAPQVNVDVTNDYNSASRELTITLKLQYTTAVTENCKYSIYITENELVTAQLLPSGDVDTNYVHNDVFRDVITSLTGDNISETTVAGRTILKKFRYTLPAEWDPAHCEVLAFVHKYGTSDEVMQAALKKVQ